METIHVTESSCGEILRKLKEENYYLTQPRPSFFDILSGEPNYPPRPREEILFEKKISSRKERFLAGLFAIAATLFSFGIGLTEQKVREAWRRCFQGKKGIRLEFEKWQEHRKINDLAKKLFEGAESQKASLGKTPFRPFGNYLTLKKPNNIEEFKEELESARESPLDFVLLQGLDRPIHKNFFLEGKNDPSFSLDCLFKTTLFQDEEGKCLTLSWPEIAVLKRHSEFFQILLEGAYREAGSEKPIRIESSKALEILLDSFYSPNNLIYYKDDLLDLFYFADFLNLKPILKKLREIFSSEFLSCLVSDSNFIENMVQFALQFPDLKEACRKEIEIYLSKHLKNLITLPDEQMFKEKLSQLKKRGIFAALGEFKLESRWNFPYGYLNLDELPLVELKVVGHFFLFNPLKRLKRLTLACEAFDSLPLRGLESLKLEELNLKQLQKHSGHFEDKDLMPLQQMKSLKKLSFPLYSRITEKGLAYLINLENLEELDLGYQNLIKDISPLQAMDGLKKLKLPLSSDGSELAGLKGFKRLEELDLSQMASISDRDLTHLQSLTGLKRLALPSTSELTGASLAYLRGLPHLEELDLRGVKGLEDGDLIHLQQMQFLKHLILPTRSKLTEKGLTYLKKLQNLENLNGIGDLSDKDLESLQKIKRLKKVSFPRRSKLTGRCLAYLKALSNLEELDLREIGEIEDKDLIHLQEMKSLKRLRLPDPSKLTKKGLTGFRNLENLEELDLGGIKDLDDETIMDLAIGMKNLRKLNIPSPSPGKTTYTYKTLHYLTENGKEWRWLW